MDGRLTVKYAVSLTGKGGIAAVTARKRVRPGHTGTTRISLSMFKGDPTDKLALAEHARKVLTLAEGYDVAILDVGVPS